MRRRSLIPLAALSLALPLALAVQSPAAADELSLSNFQLRPNEYGDELQKRTDALPLVKGTVTNIMNDLNRQNPTKPVGVGEACNRSALGLDGDNNVINPAISRSLCFNDGDNDTAQWYPQGVTTVADMQKDQEWGDGYKPVLVSWYDHNDNADGMLKGVRISFMDPGTGKYRHVLLVYPRADKNYDTIRVSEDPNNGDYNKSLHAGGIIWYGNYLFVADTARGFRMFDMRRIYDLGASENGTTSGSDKVGKHGDMYYGYGYRYVMPQVGSWTRTASTGTKCTTSDGSPNYSHVSLDRSGTDHLVAGEYCAGSEAVDGRVAAWKIAGAFTAGNELITDTAYRWNADAAHNLPKSNIQGATRFNGRWYLSQSNSSKAGTLYTTEPATSSTRVLKVSGDQPLTIGPEDLSHWPGGTPDAPALGTLWTVSEHTGKRMVYSVNPK